MGGRTLSTAPPSRADHDPRQFSNTGIGGDSADDDEDDAESSSSSICSGMAPRQNVSVDGAVEGVDVEAVGNPRDDGDLRWAPGKG